MFPPLPLDHRLLCPIRSELASMMPCFKLTQHGINWEERKAGQPCMLIIDAFPAGHPIGDGLGLQVMTYSSGTGGGS
jgi:hypothetical protein